MTQRVLPVFPEPLSVTSPVVLIVLVLVFESTSIGIKVNARVTELRGASFIMSYQIYKEEKLMAEGETTLLALDYNTRKPGRLPAAFKKAMKEFESK